MGVVPCLWSPRNWRRELRSSGSGRAWLGNRRAYREADY